MNCIYCSSSNYVRNGHDKKGVQRYKCNDCHRRFCEKGIFARHRFSSEVIINAIFLRSFPLSTRNVKRILRKVNFVKVSHKTIYNWLVKFAPYLIKIALNKPILFQLMLVFAEMKQVQKLFYKKPKIKPAFLLNFLSAMDYKGIKELARKYLEEKQDMLERILNQ